MKFLGLTLVFLALATCSAAGFSLPGIPNIGGGGLPNIGGGGFADITGGINDIGNFFNGLNGGFDGALNRLEGNLDGAGLFLADKQVDFLGTSLQGDNKVLAFASVLGIVGEVALYYLLKKITDKGLGDIVGNLGALLSQANKNLTELRSIGPTLQLIAPVLPGLLQGTVALSSLGSLGGLGGLGR